MMNNPVLWDRLLKDTPKGSVLMGGAIVDYMLGIPVHDYDIFYTYHPGHGLHLPPNWIATQADFNNPEFVKAHEEMYLQGVDEFGNNPISIVQEYFVDGEHKVQMIGVNYDNPIKHMKNFDHSLTLASYNHKGMFVSRKVFRSQATLTIEYVSKNHAAGAVMKSSIRALKKIARLHNSDLWNLKGFNVVEAAQPVGVLDF